MPQVKSNEIPYNKGVPKDKNKKVKALEKKRPEVETTIESDEFSTKVTIVIRY